MSSAPLSLLGLDPGWVAAILAGIAAIAVMVALYAAFIATDPMTRRVRVLNERREQLKAGIVLPAKRRATLVQRSDTTDRIRALLSALRVLQDEQLEQMQVKLLRAGIRRREFAVILIFARMMLPILIGGPVLYIVYGTDAVADWSPLKAYALAAGALVLSYKAPDLYLNNRIQKRSHAIRQALPDALDLLVICAEAGLTIDAAFARVAKELGRAYAELGEEFSLTAIELGFLTDRRQAFDNLATRIDLESIRGVATTMIQTEKYGTPLASSLRVLAAEFRHERMMRAEEKAARLPAIMTVPLILFILPVLFIVILGPAACSIHDTLMR
ncbi:type II secretion system F family protein [Sphingomonas sp. HT-1]|uniref:type II secretion system F family protein n=1 Tax=unclassified Sphingomonas TaxID=196159 RepID=UPI000311436D|nr:MULTISPECIES: type II secretion system F family protein [unclassified Sphingomonas]KTF67911.1 pilus assembly protein TadC [Sphingomonas sp. WG]